MLSCRCPRLYCLATLLWSPTRAPRPAHHVPCHILLIGQHKTLARLDKVFLTSWHSDNSPLLPVYEPLLMCVSALSSRDVMIICCCEHPLISSDQPPVLAECTHWPLHCGNLGRHHQPTISPRRFQSNFWGSWVFPKDNLVLPSVFGSNSCPENPKNAPKVLKMLVRYL